MAVIDDEMKSDRTIEAQPQMTAKLFEMVKIKGLSSDAAVDDSFKCPKCQKTFMTEVTFNRHQQQHVKVRPKKEKNKLLAAEKARKEALEVKRKENLR